MYTAQQTVSIFQIKKHTKIKQLTFRRCVIIGGCLSISS